MNGYSSSPRARTAAAAAASNISQRSGRRNKNQNFVPNDRSHNSYYNGFGEYT